MVVVEGLAGPGEAGPADPWVLVLRPEVGGVQAGLGTSGSVRAVGGRPRPRLLLAAPVLRDPDPLGHGHPLVARV